MSRCVIVNADDLGMSRAVNAGIAIAHERGIVTSASLLATRPAWDDALAMLRAHPALGVGMHLAWVDGLPVSDPADVPTLVDRHGHFLNGWPAFLARYLRGGINLDEVEREGAAQIERLVSAGFQPDHVDSHEHLHVLPGIFDRVTELAQRYGIMAIRVPREPMVDWWGDIMRLPGLARRAAVHGAVAMLNGQTRKLWHAAACFGIADSCHLTEQRVVRFLRALPTGVSELVCHVAATSGDPGRRERELAALTSQAAREAVSTAGLTVTTFSACHAAHDNERLS